MGLVLLAILVAAMLLYAVVVSGAGKKKRARHQPPRNHGPSTSHVSRIDPAEARGRWETILATSRTGASGLKSSINEADKFFDHVMQSQGIYGASMGERLKSARGRFSNYSTYDGVWRAHKLRNTLAHEFNFDLVPSQAHEALADFERGLRELGAL